MEPWKDSCMLCKERGISGAWRSRSEKAARAEDTGHVCKLCDKTLFILHSYDVVLGSTRQNAGHCFIIHLPGGGHCPLARDSEPIRLLEIPTSPSLYVLIVIKPNI